MLLIALIFAFIFNYDKVNGLVVHEDKLVTDIEVQPVHSMPYKLGMEKDMKSSIQNMERVKKNAYAMRAKELEAIQLAENKAREEVIKLAKKQAEEEIAAKEKQIAEEQARIEQEKLQEASQNIPEPTHSTQAAQSSGNKQAVTSSQSSASSESEQPVATQQPAQPAASASKPAPAPKPQQPTPAPTPKPQAPQYGSHQIGINGIFIPYTNYGRASTDQLQGGINAGLIVAGFTYFDGNDGETTYFGGHNPGIMRFMENNIYIGATVIVTDANGQPHHYRMIDKVDVDPYGEGVLTSIGRSAIDAYTYGTGTESILVQFCNTSNNLMSFWYGVKN